jgi:hypothetical protein
MGYFLSSPEFKHEKKVSCFEMSMNASGWSLELGSNEYIEDLTGRCQSYVHGKNTLLVWDSDGAQAL